MICKVEICNLRNKIILGLRGRKQKSLGLLRLLRKYDISSSNMLRYSVQMLIGKRESILKDIGSFMGDS